VLNIPLTSLNTFILICSSVTVVKALDSIQKGNQTGLKRYLLLTLLFGLFFLGVQVYEYYKLIFDHGLTATSYFHDGHTVNSSYGMTFYIQTGFHGAHVFLGVVWLLIVVAKAFAGLYTKDNWVGVEAFGLYWHFVDLVWILLFTIVYLV
jgi:cytochrome c oxidase subunit III